MADVSPKKISSPLIDLRSHVVYCGKSDESNCLGISLQTCEVFSLPSETAEPLRVK